MSHKKGYPFVIFTNIMDEEHWRANIFYKRDLTFMLVSYLYEN